MSLFEYIFDRKCWKNITERDGLGGYIPFSHHYYASQIFCELGMISVFVFGMVFITWLVSNAV